MRIFAIGFIFGTQAMGLLFSLNLVQFRVSPPAQALALAWTAYLIFDHFASSIYAARQARRERQAWFAERERLGIYLKGRHGNGHVHH